MDGSGHRAFAPVFTLATSALLVQSGKIEGAGIMIVACAIAGSTLTATSADADLHAYKSYATIWGLKQSKKHKPPKGLNQKIWATFFKTIGVRAHRDWRSHSPSVWIPLSILITYLSISIGESIGGIFGSIIFPAFMFGMCSGYVSHIVADAPNKGGIPYFFWNHKVSITKTLLGNRLSNIFRSGNKKMNAFLTLIMMDLALVIIAPGLIVPVNEAIFAAIKGIVGLLIASIRGLTGI